MVKFYDYATEACAEAQLWLDKQKIIMHSDGRNKVLRKTKNVNDDDN